MHRGTWTTRFTTWTCLAVSLLVASGLPLPIGGPTAAIVAGRTNPAAAARLAVKDRSTPFPCMDKACGCASAEQCFNDCCCNSPAETLAWARAHDVAPATLASLARRAAARPAKAADSCCRAAPPTCCEAAAASSCCGGGSDDEPPEEIPGMPHGAGLRGLVLRAMLACGGVADEWSSGCVSLPPPLVAWVTSGVAIATITITDDPLEALSRSPDAPPPRAG